MEPVCCSMSSSNCCFLTCIQISQEVGKVVWYSHLLKNFPQFVVIHTVKGFDILNKAKVDVFWNSLAFSIILRMLAIFGRGTRDQIEIMELGPTIERSYQTHSHNIHFKMTGLVGRFSRRKNMSSSSIHCCYIIISTELKAKHILEQGELFCCAMISSVLKEKEV